MLNSSVLVLNRSFLPIHITSAKRAFTLVFAGTANVVDHEYQTFDFESWFATPAQPDEETVMSTSGEIRIPRVIVLTLFDRLPRRHVRYSRNNIFTRDDFTCQYCGDRPPRSQLNLDHVIPRAQGGRTTWENIVASCVTCNRRKGGRTPEQAKLRLRSSPIRPRWAPLLNVASGGAGYTEWKPFLGSHYGRSRGASRGVGNDAELVQ